jgi:hypothetical protein
MVPTITGITVEGRIMGALSGRTQPRSLEGPESAGRRGSSAPLVMPQGSLAAQGDQQSWWKCRNALGLPYRGMTRPREKEFGGPVDPGRKAGVGTKVPDYRGLGL